MHSFARPKRASPEGSAWPNFLRGLCERALSGVRLIISDDHRGLVKAVLKQLPGARGASSITRSTPWTAEASPGSRCGWRMTAPGLERLCVALASLGEPHAIDVAGSRLERLGGID